MDNSYEIISLNSDASETKILAINRSESTSLVEVHEHGGVKKHPIILLKSEKHKIFYLAKLDKILGFRENIDKYEFLLWNLDGTICNSVSSNIEKKDSSAIQAFSISDDARFVAVDPGNAEINSFATFQNGLLSLLSNIGKPQSSNTCLSHQIIYVASFCFPSSKKIYIWERNSDKYFSITAKQTTIDLSFSSRGDLLASAHETSICIWRTEDFSCVDQISIGVDPPQTDEDSIEKIEFSSNGDIACVDNRGYIYLLGANTKSP